MAASDREKIPHRASKEPAVRPLVDSDTQLNASRTATAGTLAKVLTADVQSGEESATVEAGGQEAPPAPSVPEEQRRLRQGVLDFSAKPDDSPFTSDAAAAQTDDRPPSAPGPPQQIRGLFGPVSAREKPAFLRSEKGGRNGFRPRSRTPPDERTLFDFVSSEAEPDPPEPKAIPPPAGESSPAESRKPPDDLPSSVGIASGEMAKARDIVAAIRALKIIEQERRTASPDERASLAQFAGFGPVALSIFPHPVTGRYKDANWQSVGEELKSLLSGEKYDNAKRTTFNAFYTSPTVITAMHDAIERLGVPGDATILEPGCGTGNFMRYGRPEMRFIGVELDQISGRIARALHPHQDIRIESFSETRLAENSIDAVIGNVPFADVKLDYNGQRLSLHDYFFAKSVDALRPGGALALVTTHFTLDKQNAAIREYLGSKADFIGAIRLPSDAFKREGTDVVTDIIFMRKRATGESARDEEAEWHRSRPFEIDGVEVSINRYFVRHPGMVLGTWSRKGTLYGEGFSVAANGDLAPRLAEAIERLPRFPTFEATNQPDPGPAPFKPPPAEGHITEGSFFVNEDGTICQCADRQTVPVAYGGKTLRSGGTMTGRRFAGLIRLRDHARRVLQSQNEGWPQEARNDVRRELNWAYDRFAGMYGPINKTTISETAEGGVIRRMQ